MIIPECSGIIPENPGECRNSPEGFGLVWYWIGLDRYGAGSSAVTPPVCALSMLAASESTPESAASMPAVAKVSEGKISEEKSSKGKDAATPASESEIKTSLVQLPDHPTVAPPARCSEVRGTPRKPRGQPAGILRPTNDSGYRANPTGNPCEPNARFRFGFWSRSR